MQRPGVKMEEWEPSIEAAIKEVRQFISEETRLGQAGLSKISGYSTSVISSFLGGTYTGDVQRVKERLLGAIGLYRQRASFIKPAQYVRTDQAREVEAAIAYAIRFKESAAILAETGCGKSVAARYVASREFGVVYVQCDRHDYNQSAFLTKMADRLDLSACNAHVAWRMQRKIVDRLRETGWTLILDDAHYLRHPKSPSCSVCLDIVKDFQTIAETPFVLLAVPELWDSIAPRERGDWYAQLKRRLGIVRVLRCQEIQVDDVRRVIAAMQAACNPAVLRALTQLAQRPGGYGNVSKAVRWSTRDGSACITKDSLTQYLDACGIRDIRVGRDEPPATSGEHRKQPSPATASVA